MGSMFVRELNPSGPSISLSPSDGVRFTHKLAICLIHHAESFHPFWRHLSIGADQVAEDIGDRSTADMDEYATLMSTTDAELLKTAWGNEKDAPEILQFQAQLVKRAKEQI